MIGVSDINIESNFKKTRNHLAKKLKRNEVCWCGSEKKYKKCHGHQSYLYKIKTSELLDDQKQVYSKDTCYAPENFHHECSGEIIKAHTISKSSNLKPITKNGHVYCFKTSLGELIKTKGKITVKKMGINETSVFHGFCSKHDTNLFKSIDTCFELNCEHVFLNHYRTLVRELYLKEKNALFQSSKMKCYDKGMDIFQQLQYQTSLDDIHAGTDAGQRDLKIVKAILDKKLINKQFDDMRYYALIIEKIPDIISTCVWLVSSDFKNNKLIELSDLSKTYNAMSVSTLVYSETKGIIILSWDNSIKSPECYEFIETLNRLSNCDKIKAIVYWLFSINENIYFAPEWWENLGLSKQEQLSDIFNATLMDLPNLSLYHGLDVVNWSIDEIKTNLDL